MAGSEEKGLEIGIGGVENKKLSQPIHVVLGLLQHQNQQSRRKSYMCSFQRILINALDS